MQESKRVNQLSETFRTSSATYFTLKTVGKNWTEIFCNGMCAEADSLESVCLACKYEHQDWENSRK